MIELIAEKTKEEVESLFNKSEHEIQIVSPFLSMKTAKLLAELCKEKKLHCVLFTRIYIKDLVEGVNDINAIKLLVESGVEVYSLKGLHAKLYMFDGNSVILGSANFTMGGLKNNFELSILTDEINVLEQVSVVIGNLYEHCTKDNAGVVTLEMVEKIECAYKEAYVAKQKNPTKLLAAMYGADPIIAYAEKKDLKWAEKELEKEDVDPIFDLLSGTQNKKNTFTKNIWIKFEGKGAERQPGYEIPSINKVNIDGEEKYIVNFRNRPSGIQTGDVMFIASYTTDDNGQPTVNIVGRGVARVYEHKNKVKADWLKQHPWMEYYRYYCEVEELELLNIPKSNCISLEQVHAAVGKRTYVSTLEKDDLINLARVRCRQSHLRLTTDAMDYLNAEIDKLAAQVGFAND